MQTVSDRLALSLTVAAILLMAATGIFYWASHPMLIYPDQALYVHMAKLLLAGKVPYVDMFDNNPPLAIYLQVVPVCLASALRLTEPLAFSLYIWTLIILSGTVGGIALFRAQSREILLVGLAAIGGFVYFNVQQIVDFGQREHIFAILYLPFFIVRYLRWQDKKLDLPLAILAGVMAGVGIALKHYFLLVALAPEIVWAIDKRSLRNFCKPETAALSATILLYLLHFLFLPKEEIAAYFGVIVPIYKAGYSYYTTSLSYNLNTYWRGDFYLMALTSLGALALSRRSSFIMPWQAFSLVSMVIFVLAGQVWSYHVVPVRLANNVAVFVQVYLLATYFASGVRRGKLAALALPLALFAVGGWQTYGKVRDVLADREKGEEFFMPTLGYDGTCPAGDINPYTQIVIDNTTRDDTILFISSSMGPGYPVYLQSRRRPASRFLHAMILPLLASVIDDRSLSVAERDLFRERMRQFLAWYGEDIAVNKPKLIFVQNNFVYGLLSSRNFIKKHMGDYKLLLTRDEYRVYSRD